MLHVCSMYIRTTRGPGRWETHACHEPDRNIEERRTRSACQLDDAKATDDQPVTRPTRANSLPSRLAPRIPKHDSLGSHAQRATRRPAIEHRGGVLARV